MPSSDDLLAGGPPVAAEAEADTPFLGVPKSYVAQRSVTQQRSANVFGANVRLPGTVQGTVAVAPRYYKGDEYAPSTFAAEDRARLQLAMRQAGLYTKNERSQLGVWDENTRGAYKRLLEYANGAGLDWQRALNEFGSAKAKMGDTTGGSGGGGDRAPLAVRVSNPADLRKAFDTGALAALGHRLDAAELDRWVAAYQQAERNEQTQAYNAADAGGTVIAAPDLDTFVEDRAKAVDPQGAFRQRAIGVFGELGQILGGGFDAAE